MVSHKHNLDNIWVCINLLRIVPEPSLFWKHIANPKPYDWTLLKKINKVIEKSIGNTIGHNPFDIFSLLGLWNRFNFTDFLAEYVDVHTDDGGLDDGGLDDGGLDEGDLDDGGSDDEKYNHDAEDGLPDDEKYIHDVEEELPEDDDDDFGDDVGDLWQDDDDYGDDVGDLWQDDGDLG